MSPNTDIVLTNTQYFNHNQERGAIDMYFFEQILYEATLPTKSAAPKSPQPQKTQSIPPPPAPVPPMSAAQAKQIQSQPLTREQTQAQAEAQAQHAAAVAQQAQIHAQQAQSLAGIDPNTIPDDLDYSESDLDDGENESGDVSEDEDTTLIPIKRYYLIQKLFALNDKLNELHINNDVLNIVISFIDSFSYESLLKLTNKFVEEVYFQITGKSQPEESNEMEFTHK